MPLDGNSWERQERVLLPTGDRVISYDRRGFGRSSHPTTGYDYDTLAADLNTPEGVDGQGFEGSRISDQAWQASFNVAAGSSPYATYACVDTWLTDFRGDLPKINVPTLVVHGTADRILPISATAERLPR